MKVLVHSNAPWAATGYGMQCADLAQRMQEDGHEVAISAFYGLAGCVLGWNGIRVYPGGMNPFGNDVLAAHAADWFGGDPKDGLLITLVDAWVLSPSMVGMTNAGCWAPVDHDPVPPRVAQFFKECSAAPIAMSRFGEEQLKAQGLSPYYAPHGVDTETFKPQDRKAARKTVGLPEDKFVVGMIAANKDNPSRKGFSEAFQAFRKFLDKHDDAILYLHTEPTGFSTGVNLHALLDGCGIPPTNVHFCNQYAYQLSYPREYVAAAHSALDVLINPAMGEGFGIPIVEAQACGSPVIVTDCTAMSELCGVGWAVPGQKFWTPQESFQFVPDVDAIVEALHDLHDNPRDREEAVEFASQYDSKKVYEEHWKPTLAALKSRFDPSVEVVSGLPKAA